MLIGYVPEQPQTRRPPPELVLSEHAGFDRPVEITQTAQGVVVVDPARKRVTRAGKPVTLSRHEYRTLVALMERRGGSVSREQLEEAVYGAEREIESNTIAVFIHQLRRKLGDDLIATVHGFGYRLGEAR